MLRQVFESDPVWYQRYPASGWLCGTYNGYLRVPPRVYEESINMLIALFASPAETEGARHNLTAIVAMDFVCWPSWRVLAYRFDPYTGAVLGRSEMGGAALTIDKVALSRDGTLWALNIYGVLNRLDATTLEPTGETFPSGHWAGSTPAAHGISFCIDSQRGIAVLHTGGEANDQVGVYSLTDGALVRRIGVAGAVHDISPEDETRVWVMATNGVMTLLDYDTGATLSVTRQPAQPRVLASVTTWDKYLRRMLTLQRTPDEVDGAGTTRIHGYFPRPIPVGITSPIPLRVPRRGREVPMLVNAYGDTGELISGVKIDLSATAPGRLLRRTSQTSARGAAIVQMACDDEGSTTLTAEAAP